VSAPVLGKLEWRAAAEVPELVYGQTLATLQQEQIPAYAVGIDPELADTAAFCAAYEVPMEASANCVIVHGKRAGESMYAGVMVLATHRADVNGVIRKQLGARKISFAAQDDAVGSTGMEYGGITPIGLPHDWPVYVDTAVAQAGLVVIGSGIRGSKLLIDGAELAKLPAATVLDLATLA
jgi:prolyl-tRNA editing enzyme YbaK/EbsC (Cys-tRNA(Pro) deacylase)